MQRPKLIVPGIRVAAVAAAATLLAGCTSYYRVTVPEGESVYYTTKIKHHDGGVTFTDARTQREVNLEGSEVEEITKQQYKAAVRPQ